MHTPGTSPRLKLFWRGIFVRNAHPPNSSASLSVLCRLPAQRAPGAADDKRSFTDESDINHAIVIPGRWLQPEDSPKRSTVETLSILEFLAAWI